MAIVERIVAQGNGYMVALQLDDVAKTLIGLHGINTTAKAITLLLVTTGTTRDRTLGAGADVTITLPQARPYSDVAWLAGGFGVDVNGLDSFGLAA